jgi:class 3 adenylate cyclase
MRQELPEGSVTALFSVVVGSTDLTTRRGDQAVQDILRPQRELAQQHVEQHSGQSRTRT